MNNPDHISEILETIFWVKILKFFDADRDGKNPQHLKLHENMMRKKLCKTPFLVKSFEMSGSARDSLRNSMKLRAFFNDYVLHRRFRILIGKINVFGRII
jgi:hypothetical protein